jgi:HUS1 checkpoint protein
MQVNFFMKLQFSVTNLALFHQLIAAIEKLDVACLVKFSQSHVQLVVKQSLQLQIWQSIPIGMLFDPYRIQSESRDICLHINLAYLSKVLTSCASVDGTCHVKLSSGPCLEFGVQELTGNELVRHTIPVRVLSEAQQVDVQEPMLPEAQVHILLPPLNTLKHVTETVKHMGDYVTIAANMQGTLQLSVNSVHVHSASTFTQLVNPQLQEQEQQAAFTQRHTDPAVLARVRISTKDWTRFLACHHVRPSSIVCSIVHDTALVAYVYLGADQSAYLIYYIPSHAE